MLEFFTGRSNRQEYWISVALLLIVAAVLNLLGMEMAGFAITIMWIITWVRRLHDVNLSGWWAALPIAIVFVAVAALIAFSGIDVNAMQRAIENDGQALTGNAASLLWGAVVLGGVIQLGFTIWLGIRAGTAGKNKFGEPPEPIFRR